MKIICPYCFKEMEDNEVLFRSEKVNKGENDILPEEYDSVDDFNARYREKDKSDILNKLKDWQFFEEQDDDIYRNFWDNFNGTTEYNLADDMLGVKAYRRKIIDPQRADHQNYLKRQPDQSFFIRDNEGMVTQIELKTGELCYRRVCKHCHNPLPNKYGKFPVKFTTVIGITGAGKTIYLSQILKKMTTYAARVGLTAFVNNTGVQNFVEKNEVKAGSPLPGSTPATQFQQPLFYEMVKDVGGRSHTETLVLYDVAGEVFKTPDLVIKFAPFIKRANGVILLIDPMQFEAVCGVNQVGEQLDDPVTVLNVIHEQVTNKRANEKCNIPFAVCISKVDTLNVQQVLPQDLRNSLLMDVQGEINNNGFARTIFNAKSYNPIANSLSDFIKTNEMGLAQTMYNNYGIYNFFAFTALGCAVEASNNGGVNCPVGPILPKRIEEPLFWLFNQYGYIDTNEPVFDPSGRVRCPDCNSFNTEELPENEQFIKHGFWIFSKKNHVNRVCKDCKKKWKYIPDSN